LAELRDERFIFISRATTPLFTQWLHELCAAAGFSPRVVREVTRPELVLDLVAGGIGISLLAQMRPEATHEDVRLVPLERPRPRLRQTVSWLKDRPRGAMHDFLDLALKARRQTR
jgi:DNA-binding transcriptional LysR family regulator